MRSTLPCLFALSLLIALTGCEDAAGTGVGLDDDATDALDAEETDAEATDAQIEDSAEADLVQEDTSEPPDDVLDAADVNLEPPCERSSTRIVCAHDSIDLEYEAGARRVHVALPAGAPPAEGWPVAIFFQGSFMSASLSWDATPVSLYGLYYRVEAAADLLDAGFAVIAPEARFTGYWDTNIQPWASSWEGAPDDAMMRALLGAIDDGSLGPLDASALFAAGISSGGYMTSRMALSYPGRFSALVIASGSWATCGGAFCVVPDSLPAEHPPTLFLHGGSDTVVPSWTMEPYHEGLEADGVPTETHVETFLAHAWHPESAELMTAWFERFLP